MHLNFIYIVLLSWILLVTAGAQDSTSVAEIRVRLDSLERILKQRELQDLLEEAKQAAGGEERPAERADIFKSRQNALQALNPEISVVGDFYSQYLSGDGFTDETRSGIFFRTIAMHVRSDLDPFSYTKISFEWGGHGAEVTEAYMVWTNLFGGTSLTAGYFRQQFGVINRWHEHALDQFDIPLPLKSYFGAEGLTQAGFSLDWMLPPVTADVNQLTLQVTNSQNEELFAGEFFSTPSVIGRFKNYWDISEAAYFELGLSGLWGTNHFRGFDESGVKIKESSRNTFAAGIDLTWLWEPPATAKYRSFVWRGEAMFMKKELPDNIDIEALGGFSYAEYKLGQRSSIGLRTDYTQPLVAGKRSKYLYQLVPYWTWRQSEWVTLRLQYNYLDGPGIAQSDQRVTLHLNWAAGPHLHDRY